MYNAAEATDSKPMKSCIGDVSDKLPFIRQRYLAAFRADYYERNFSRNFVHKGNALDIFPGVFPSDSPLTYSANSIVDAIEVDLRTGNLERDAVSAAADVGTGCGVLLVWLRSVFPTTCLIGIDNNRIACMNALKNVRILGVENCRVVQADLFSDFSVAFDLIVASLPMTRDFQQSVELDHATLARFCAQLPTHLTKEGKAYVAWASWADFSIADAIFSISQLRIDRVHTHPPVFRGCYWRTYVLSLQ